jgi:hypothetical protein
VPLAILAVANDRKATGSFSTSTEVAEFESATTRSAGG